MPLSSVSGHVPLPIRSRPVIPTSSTVGTDLPTSAVAHCSQDSTSFLHRLLGPPLLVIAGKEFAPLTNAARYDILYSVLHPLKNVTTHAAPCSTGDCPKLTFVKKLAGLTSTMTNLQISMTIRDGGDDNLADQAYSGILALLEEQGSFTPERLNVTKLADIMGISRTPVSMALMRLEGEGLVRRGEDQTWTTVPLSLDKLNEIFDIKQLLDPWVAREAAGRISPGAAEALLALAEDMLEAAESSEPDRWIANDRRYHAILLEAAGNKELDRILRGFSRKLHQLKSIDSVIESRMVVASRYHAELAEAVSVRDQEAAAQCAVRDVQTLRNAVMDVMENVLIPLLGKGFSS